MLAKEPWGLPLDRAARLTLYQIFQVYFRPDPERARSAGVPEGAVAYGGPFFMYWEFLSRKGVTDAEIVARWRRDYPQYADQAVILPAWKSHPQQGADGRGQGASQEP